MPYEIFDPQLLSISRTRSEPGEASQDEGHHRDEREDHSERAANQEQEGYEDAYGPALGLDRLIQRSIPNTNSTTLEPHYYHQDEAQYHGGYPHTISPPPIALARSRASRTRSHRRRTEGLRLAKTEPEASGATLYITSPCCVTPGLT